MIQPITWEENQTSLTRNLVTQSHLSAPRKIQIADDTLKADHYYQAASQGAGFIWRGDFQNAKQLLQAVERRIQSHSQRKKSDESKSAKELFHQHRQAQAHRAQLLSRLMIVIEPDLSIQLRRAPDVAEALRQALEQNLEATDGFVVSLRELLGFIGAFEWRRKGVQIEALGAAIHPFYGVFSPVRGEYLDLVIKAPLPPSITRAFDIGTGTGILAALLAKRGVPSIIATDTNPAAIACARLNLENLGYANRVKIEAVDLFPAGEADLIICNPPWVPARPTSPIEHAVYDEDHKMLKSFLTGVRGHLSPLGEAWLIMSDLAVHLGLRQAGEVEELVRAGGLEIIERLDTSPQHRKIRDEDDLLHRARAKETTSLYRLRVPTLT